MKTLIATIQGSEIYRYDDAASEIVRFVADADIDCDGSGGNPDHDPYYQDDTTLHDPSGKALNAYKVPFAVVPPVVCKRTKGKVLGSLCHLRNINNDKVVETVVGDIGPRRKIGEVSVAAARALGLSGNPNHGGTSDKIIEYEIEVGVPATINGVTYKLKSYGS